MIFLISWFLISLIPAIAVTKADYEIRRCSALSLLTSFLTGLILWPIFLYTFFYICCKEADYLINKYYKKDKEKYKQQGNSNENHRSV